LTEKFRLSPKTLEIQGKTAGKPIDFTTDLLLLMKNGQGLDMPDFLQADST